MTTDSKTCAAYARVSSATQAQANGTDAQRAAIERWAGAQGLDPAGLRWFEDLGISGRTMDRPGWRAMMAEVEAGRVRTIIVFDLSRCGRTLRGLCEWIERMGARKVRVVFVQDGIDLGTMTGRLLAHVLGAVAEFIRQQGAEKIKEGVREGIRKRGGRWGFSCHTVPALATARQVNHHWRENAGPGHAPNG